jgi:hypothetical protein
VIWSEEIAISDPTMRDSGFRSRHPRQLHHLAETATAMPLNPVVLEHFGEIVRKTDSIEVSITEMPRVWHRYRARLAFVRPDGTDRYSVSLLLGEVDALLDALGAARDALAARVQATQAQ